MTAFYIGTAKLVAFLAAIVAGAEYTHGRLEARREAAARASQQIRIEDWEKGVSASVGP